METWSLTCPEIFRIADEKEEKKYEGCGQGWYRKKWQRMAGCGPTAASNIILYLNRNADAGCGEGFLGKEECLSLMEDMWEFVTPGLQGVHTTRMFYEGVLGYAESKDMKIGFEVCDIPKDRSERPEFSRVLGFIEDGLARDCPVAFLNLCNGQELSLDRWHWVTIISLEHDGDMEKATVEVLDEGAVKRLNLALWFNTTKRGGGFVYCVKKNL